MKFKIEKNIPIPTWARGPRRSKFVELFAALTPGDSTVMTIKDSRAFQQQARKAKIRIITRRQADGNVRVWLVEKPVPVAE
jgi:hypothetical protein